MKAKIKAIVAVPEVGEVYHGVVKNIQPFGAFVEVLPGKDGARPHFRNRMEKN